MTTGEATAATSLVSREDEGAGLEAGRLPADVPTRVATLTGAPGRGSGCAAGGGGWTGAGGTAGTRVATGLTAGAASGAAGADGIMPT